MKIRSAALTTVGTLVVGSVFAQPTVTTQPADGSVSLGANVTFEVIASGTTPLFYQWRFNELQLLNATNRSLVLTNIQLVNAGDYTAVVADSSGSVTSQVAHLEVDPVFTKITAGPIVNDAGNWVGCAWGDSDNDGFIDLFITSAADANESLQRNAFYHNNGNGTFTRITTNAIVNEAGNWRGAAWADYDNDGHLDLFVTRVDGDGFPDQTALYHNNGDGSFTQMRSSILGDGVSGGFAKGCVWGDFDNDGFVDMFIARNSGTPWLLQNNGDGTLTMLTNDVGITPDNQESQFAMWGDYDDDGWPDVVVTDLVVDSQFLYHNNRNGTFTGGVVTEGPGGGAWVDYDNDGNLDLIVGNSVVYHNNGNSTFTKEPSLQVGPVWGDYDNDGFIDASDGDFLYHNNGDGTFTRVSSAALENDQGIKIAAAWGDYDNDGFLDLFVTRVGNDTNLLYRNNGNSNSWIKFKLVGTLSNRSAIGAKVRVKATLGGRTFWQMREINTGDGFDVSPLGAHFGLGNATNIDLVRIEWPSGIVQTLTDVSPKQFLTVVEHQENAAGPITFTATETASDGAIKLSVSGKPGLRYLFEGSTNLVNWTKIGVRTNVTGTVEFLDSKAANFNGRFYRASAP